MVAVTWIFRRWHPFKLDRLFRRLQLVSAGALQPRPRRQRRPEDHGHHHRPAGRLGHTCQGHFDVPLWVMLISHAAIALGTMFGGWRIVKTMGTKITKLQPFGGFCAETAGAITLVGATLAGIPVSTTHTITGAIIGVGATRRLSAVKWGVAGASSGPGCSPSRSRRPSRPWPTSRSDASSERRHKALDRRAESAMLPLP